jgi:hypothetical protein
MTTTQNLAEIISRPPSAEQIQRFAPTAAPDASGGWRMRDLAVWADGSPVGQPKPAIALGARMSFSGSPTGYATIVAEARESRGDADYHTEIQHYYWIATP